MGEHFIKLDFAELETVVFYCPACGVGLKFDLGKMPSLLGCACGRAFPENERRIIGDLAEAFHMYGRTDGKFKVEFEVKA